MDSNTVLRDVNEDIYEKVQKFIGGIYNIIARDAGQGIKESFEIKTLNGKVVFIYYNNRTLMIQSSLNNSDYVSLVQKISEIFSIKPEQKNKIIPKEERELIYDYFIGCDESGAGEAFGSLFLGCALLSKENLQIIHNIINGKNIRKLEKNELIELRNATKDKYFYRIKQYTPSEIDTNSKNLLLDRGYVELISRAISEKSNAIVIIDDYGIRQEMQKFITSLTTKGFKVIVKVKADEEYLACKIASLLARCARANEIESNNNKYSIVTVNTNEKLRPGSGSASNIITERYLIEYRKNYPFSEFPPFVRKKWNNVMQVEIKHPKQIEKFFIPCFYCKKSLTLIYMRYNVNIGTKLYCPECGNLIPVPEFKKYFNSRLIALDTSTIISRIVSKDLHSTRILQGNKFLLPTFVYEELDTKGPNLKKGGQKEILELKEMKMKGIIEFGDVDTHLLVHGLSNDRKILSVLINQNAVLLTKDKTMTSFGKVNHFVLSIEGL